MMRLYYGLFGIGVFRSLGFGANKPISLQASTPTRWNKPLSPLTSICIGVSFLYVLSTVNFNATLYPASSEATSTVLSGCTRPSSSAFNVALRLVSSTPPVFLKTMKALVTSPMPWLTSMLVLHPSISTEIVGPPPGPGKLVCVTAEVSEATTVGVFVAVINRMGVEVATGGVDVALATPITTGVAVKIDGVFVGGRNGVGGLKGPG